MSESKNRESQNAIQNGSLCFTSIQMEINQNIISLNGAIFYGNSMRRASAYDVFAPSILSSAAGISGNPSSSRRSSFRATGQETNMYKENSPSPEKNDTALFVEEDRRMRRRGSQLYVVTIFFSIHFFFFLFVTLVLIGWCSGCSRAFNQFHVKI